MATHPTDAAEGRPLILLVEDDAALGRALKFSLEIEGYEVDLMASAEALLDRAFPGPPVIIITDLRLPGRPGIEALETLRDRGVTAPAILVTTLPTRALRRRAAAADVMVLEKPILDDGLKTAIASFWRA